MHPTGIPLSNAIASTSVVTRVRRFAVDHARRAIALLSGIRRRRARHACGPGECPGCIAVTRITSSERDHRSVDRPGRTARHAGARRLRPPGSSRRSQTPNTSAPTAGTAVQAMISSRTTMSTAWTSSSEASMTPDRRRSAAAAVLSASRPSDVALAARASLFPSRLSPMADSRVSSPSMRVGDPADGIGRRPERRHAQDVDRPQHALERLEVGPHARDRVGGRVDAPRPICRCVTVKLSAVADASSRATAVRSRVVASSSTLVATRSASVSIRPLTQTSAPSPITPRSAR